MNILKKIIQSSLVLFIFVGIFNIVQVDAKNNNVNIIYENSYISKYTIVENDIIYTIIDDRMNDLLVINDYVYSSEEFLKIYEEHTHNCFEYLMNQDNLVKNKVNYDLLFNKTQNYESQVHFCNNINVNGISTYCTTCPLKTTVVPKAGYNTKGYVLAIKKITDSAALIFSNSDAFITALAKKLGITIAIATGIPAKLLALGITYGMYIVGDRTVKQYTHKVCYKAIKEEELIVLSDKGGKKKEYKKTATRYYYNARP